MEDDIDIYEDLPSFEARDEEKYKVEIKELSEKCNNLQQENSELKLKVDELSKNNKILSDNLSSLLKTAKAEIARKDRMITDLRQQHDNMAFRRKGYAKPRPPKAPGKPARDNTYIPFVAPPLYQTPNFEIAPPLYQTPDFEIAPPLYQTPDFEIDDTEQVYEPEKVANTVFGERLRKKILLEEELERAQKEEAKLAALENKAPPVKAEVELIEENRIETHIVKKETETQIVKKETETPIVKKVPEEKSNGFLEQAVVSEKSSGISSISSTLPSHEEDDRNLWDRRDLRKNLFSKRMNDEAAYPEQKRRRMEDERYHSDDSRYYNDNVKHESRFNLEKSDNCPSRDSAKVMHRRRSNNREEVERKREFHGERSKSNHRSRSKSPPQDRRLVEKRADRHRTDKYRAYMDKYEKRRRSGNNKKNDFSKNFGKDLRATIENKFQRKVGGRSEYDDYKNSKFGKDSRRGSRESPPSEKSRSCSSGRVRGKADDKRRARPSKSSDRLVNAKNTEKTRKERKTVKTRSKDRKSKVAERMNLDTEIKLEKSPRTSAEKELNRQIASASALDAFAPLPNLDAAPEELKKHPKRVRKKSKELTLAEMKDCRSESKSQISSRMSSEKEGSNKLLASSALLSDTSEKNLTNKQHVSTTKSGKGARSKSKELTVAEMKDHDSESKSQTQLRTVSEKEITKKELTSTTLLPDCLASLSESVAKTKSKELSVDKESDAEPKSEKLSSTTCEKEATNKQHVSSELLPDDSKKEVANKQVISIALLPEDLASLPQSDMMPEDPKEREGSREISKETTVAEENDSQPKSRAGSSSEKEMRNKPLASSAISFEVCEKNVINKQFVPETSLLEGLASFPESNAVPEDLQKLRKGARRKSKELTPSEQKDSESTSSTQAGANFEKEVMDKQLASTAPLPDGSASSTESSEISKDIQKQCETARGKPKEPVVAKEKERNSGQYKSRDRSRTRTKLSSEREIQNTLLDSSELLSENSEKNVKNYDGSAKTLSEGFVLLQESDAELKKECRGARNKSTEATVVEEKDRDSEPTSQTRSRTSSERQVTNKLITSSKPFSEDSEKKMTNYELLPANPLLEGLVSVPESDAELKKQRRGSTSKSKEATIVEEKDRNSEPKSQTRSRTSSEIEVTNKQLASSELLSEDSEKKVTNCELLPANPLSEGLVSLLESDAELKNQRRDATRKSKEATVVEEKDRNSEPKSQTRSRTSSEIGVTNKQLASSDLLSEDSEKKVTNCEFLPANPLSEGLVSLPESDAEPKKQRRSATRKSEEATVVEEKDRNSEPKSQTRSKTSSEIEVTNKQLASSELLSEDSEKKVTYYELVPANPLSEGLVSSKESDGELKKERRNARRKSKEATVVEEKDHDLEPKSQTRPRTSSEREVTNKQLASSELLSEDSAKKVTNCELLPANPLSEGLVSSKESDAELKKERRNVSKKSKEATVVEEKDHDLESKSQTRPRTISEEEVTNKELASSALLQLASALLPKQRKSARRRSKDSETTVVKSKDQASESKSQTLSRLSSEKELTKKQLASSALLPGASEKDARNNQDISIIPSPLPESNSAPDELRKESKGARRKSKDPKRRIAKENDQDSEPKFQTPSRTSSEEEITNEKLASCVPEAVLLTLNLESKRIPDTPKDPNGETRKSPTATLQNVVNQFDSPGKWLSSVLENDTEVTSLSSEILEPSDIGSRSFREEKIENIEKFIQNYQDDENLYCQNVKGDTGELDSETISCISNTSILDTLTMETEVGKPEDDALNNSIMSEQLLLDSLLTPIKKTSPPLPTILPPDASKQPPLPLMPHPDEKKQDLSPDTKKQPPSLLPDTINKKSPGRKQQASAPVPFSDTTKPLMTHPSLDSKTQQSSPSPDTKNRVILSSSESKRQSLLPLPSSNMEKQILPPPPSSESKSLKLPTSDMKNQPLPPPRSSDTKIEALPTLLSSDKKQEIPTTSPDIKNQAMPTPTSADAKEQPLPLLPSSETKEKALPPLPPTPDTKKQPLPPLPPTPDTKQQPLPPLPPTPDTKQQPLPPLPPTPDTKQQPLPPLPPTPDTKQQPLPPLSSSDPKEQPLPLLPSSETKEKALPLPSSETKEKALPLPSSETKEKSLPLPSSETKEKALPLPSSEIKEKALPSLPPTPDAKKQPLPPLPPTPDTKQQPLPPSPPTSDMKKQVLPPLPSPDTREKTLPPLPSTPDTKKQALPPLSPSPGVAETHVPLLASDTEKRQSLPSLLCTNERSELSSPSLPSAVEKKVLPATPEEKTKPSVLLAPEEKQDLPLLSITPPEDKTKTRLLPELASSEKENLSPISVPEDITKSVLRSSLDSTEKKGHSSQLPASNETNNATSKLPIDKVEEESLSKLQTSLEMDSTPEMEASSETKDFSSQLSASSEKEESLSKLQTSLEKKDSTSEMEASNERKVSSSQLPASTDKNLEISVTQQISASLEPEKTRAQKVAMKQIRRHKIPCTPIVSRYSRKRRDLVLTDSQASQCVIKPDSPSDTQTNNNAKVAITVSHVFKKEAAIILKRVVSPKSDDNPSEQSNNNDNSKIERPEKLSKAVNGSSPENERKIYSKTPNGTPELRKTDKTDSHSEIDPATIPGEEIPNSEPEKNEEELQPQLESKAALPKMQNPEAGSKFEKPISAKPVEIRGKRTALKTIAPPDPDGDVIGASTSRKRPLPKEKENESKQIAKQCKIMVVARRRRPVHLEDSSSATTLVPSAEDTNFDEPLKNNSVKNTLNSEKPELVQPVAERASKRRKRRSADNLST